MPHEMTLHGRFIRTTIALFVSIPIVLTSTQSQGTVKLGGGFGITSPMADFGGSTRDYYDGSRHGFAGGLNIHGKAKFALTGFVLTTQADLSTFGNVGHSELNQGSVEISQRILSLKVGPEFRFGMPGAPLTPYVGVALAVHRFSGETSFLGVSKVSSATYSVKSAARFGFGVSAGVEVSVGPLLALDINASYHVMNIAGREWEDVNPSVDQRIDSYLALNDGTDPNYASGDDKHFISNDRSISSVLLSVSLLFGL